MSVCVCVLGGGCVCVKGAVATLVLQRNKHGGDSLTWKLEGRVPGDASVTLFFEQFLCLGGLP